MFKKKTALTLAIVMVLSFSTMTAFAVNPSEQAPTVEVTGETNITIGDLPTITFGSVELTGTATQTSISTFGDGPITLTDATGTGKGWTVSLKATQFELENIDKEGTPNYSLNTLPEGSLIVAEPTIEAAKDSNSTPVDSDTVLSGGKIDSDDGSKSVDILSAAINKGMGTYTITPGVMTLSLHPKDAKDGTYTSTITMTLTQGPVTP